MSPELNDIPAALTPSQAATKRLFDVAIAAVGLVVTAPLLVAGWLASVISTRTSGVFRQVRVGRHGEPFKVVKLRTMRAGGGTTVTTARDPRITRVGAWMRRLKIDEIPQLFNVLRGEMSLVGPRPDVPGFADRLTGADRIVLSVRPGITSLAAIAYRNEESLLADAAHPEAYNREVIWPEKVRINREYLEHWSLMTDVRCICRTVTTMLGDSERSPR